MKREIIKLSIVVNNQILDFISPKELKEGNIIETKMGKLQLTNVKPIYEYSDNEKNVKHFACCGKIVDENMVGVTQVKFIMASSYADAEKKLNEFLNETKFTHTILDITHTMAYVCVTYKLRNETEIYASKNSLKAYQEL
jgi:hypothetical protein